VTASPLVERDGRRDRWIVALYIGLIMFAESCVSFVSPVVGAAMYAVTLMAMLTHVVVREEPANVARPATRRLAVADALTALSFLPVLRLVSMTAPVGAGSTAGRYLLVAAIVLTAIAWAAWGVRLPGACLQPRVPILEFGVAWLAVPLGVGAYFATRPGPVAEGESWTKLATAALAVVLVAVVEEIIFRGFVQASFVRVYGAVAAPVFAAVLYVIFYLGVRPGGMIAYAAILGLLLGWVVQRSHSLVAPIVAHAMANVALFVLLPHLASSPST
jgi:membrane protease YdiL (CAAX protease family)